MLFILFGIIGGILSGLLGIGGGSVYIPAMVLALGTTQQLAQGVSLLVMLPTAMLGGYFYASRGYVEKKLILPLIIGAIIGGTLGGLLANILPTTQLSLIFSVVMFTVGFKMLRN